MYNNGKTTIKLYSVFQWLKRFWACIVFFIMASIGVIIAALTIRFNSGILRDVISFRRVLYIALLIFGAFSFVALGRYRKSDLSEMKNDVIRRVREIESND